MRSNIHSFDVVVIGGGHAGCEAAAVAARMGARVALVTMSRATIGAMSCNPSIGGVGKGHLVREIDAFDGIMAAATDHAGIHYRMLNRSKGRAVQGPRVQADRGRYAAAVRCRLAQDGVAIVEGRVDGMIVAGGRVTAVVLADGSEIAATAVVLSTGTFLDAWMYRGEERIAGGRTGEGSSTLLARQLADTGLSFGRLKTGTPPRLDGRTIAWDRLPRQESDIEPWTLSPFSGGRTAPQLFCATTRTNMATHEIIRANLSRSPLHAGGITGDGPRYCPSIEDKVRRFGDRDGHQLFLEPEGLNSHLVYPNGISTSLPTTVQADLIRTVRGLERAEIVVPGYAVEYGHVDPRGLDARLAARNVEGLFLAGQVNGTTGYEEAAAQGLVAGLNAAATAIGKPPIRFDRRSSYIGVMIDDLTLQGVTEPYRMLTARAELRLSLRSDNAETRLRDLAQEAGCRLAGRRAARRAREDMRASLTPFFAKRWTTAAFAAAGIDVEQGLEPRTLEAWLRHPQVSLAAADLIPQDCRGDVADEMLEDARYRPYIERQRSEIDRHRDPIRLPDRLRYADIAGLSNEMVERLDRARPSSLDEASRIRGITPAALSAILVASRRPQI